MLLAVVELVVDANILYVDHNNQQPVILLVQQDCNPPKGMFLGYINMKLPHARRHDVSPYSFHTSDFTWYSKPKPLSKHIYYPP
jgi:hypothetical protein